MLKSGFENSGGQRNHWFCRAALIAAAGLLLAAGSAFAQDAQTPPPASDQNAAGGMGKHGHHHRGMPSADEQLKHLTKRLSLSDDQQAKLKPILEDQHNQMEQLRSDTTGTREDRWKKMREIRESSDTQIKTVLNEDQQKKFDKMREEQRSRLHEHGNMGEHPSGGEAQPQQ